MEDDKQLVLVLHLSQLLNLITGIGGLIAPLIIWLLKKEEVKAIEEHGKAVLNFQISMLLYGLISIPLIFLFGLGIVLLTIIGLLMIIFPILNAFRVNKGEKIAYPFSFSFLK